MPKFKIVKPLRFTFIVTGIIVSFALGGWPVGVAFLIGSFGASLDVN